MSKMMEPILGEFQQEAATTKRVLDRVPPDKLAWKPHPKSMSLGELAMHVATIPGQMSKMAQADEFEISPQAFNQSGPKNLAEITAALESGVQTAQEYLGGVSDAAAVGNWKLSANGKQIVAMPRIAMIRAFMLNHWYHHRGQLSVYLRLLDVPVPTIYGPSADENPFAA
jgi:uncharacterized damage-inducible protein DinB